MKLRGSLTEEMNRARCEGRIWSTSSYQNHRMVTNPCPNTVVQGFLHRSHFIGMIDEIIGHW